MLLGLVVDLVGLGSVLGLGGFVEQRVKLGVVVLRVIRGVALAEIGAQEVAQAGVIREPGGAVGAWHVAAAVLVAEALEVWVGVAGGGDAQNIGDVIGDRVGPGLIIAVDVVVDEKFAAKGLDLVGLCPKFLGFSGLYSRFSTPGILPSQPSSAGEVKSRAGVRVPRKILSLISGRLIAMDTARRRRLPSSPAKCSVSQRMDISRYIAPGWLTERPSSSCS